MKFNSIIGVIIVLGALSLISCDPDELVINDREVLQTLADEPGRIEYYCNGDTTFIYLSTDDEGLPDLYLVKSVEALNLLDNKIGKINFLKLGNCEINGPYIQESNIPVVISGELLENYEVDPFQSEMSPFKITDLKTVVCEKDSLHREIEIDTIVGEWNIYRIIYEDSIWWPSCEYADVTLTFGDNEAYGDSEVLGDLEGFYNVSYDLGTGECALIYKVISESAIEIKRTTCVLGFAETTHALRSFYHKAFYQMMSRDEQIQLIYQFKNNWLTISDEFGNRMELFRTE